jgi:hypothetical protein
MSQVKASIFNPITGSKHDTELPDDVPMTRLVPAIVRELGLPLYRDEKPLLYKLLHFNLHIILGDEDTLSNPRFRWTPILYIMTYVGNADENGQTRIKGNLNPMDEITAGGGTLRKM